MNFVSLCIAFANKMKSMHVFRHRFKKLFSASIAKFLLSNIIYKYTVYEEKGKGEGEGRFAEIYRGNN